MERILEWKPKGLHKLSMMNEKQNIMMEKSLGTTLPLRLHGIGKFCYFVILDYETIIA